MNSLTHVTQVAQVAENRPVFSTGVPPVGGEFSKKDVSYKYHVRLASIETEEEENGDYIYLIPTRFKAIEVIVTDNCEASIKAIVASLGLLKEYEIFSYYLPIEIENAPF